MEDIDRLPHLLECERVLKKLVDSLPRCDGVVPRTFEEQLFPKKLFDGDKEKCTKPATRAHGRGGQRFCDEHSHGAPDYPRAEALREAIALLKETP